MNNGRFPRDKGGMMPFSAVAVTILVMVSAWAVAAHGFADSEDERTDIGKETDAAFSASEDVAAWIERGLGEIIRTVSTSEEGTLEERSERFSELSDEWMDRMFPAVTSGMTVTVDGWDYTLTSTLLHRGTPVSAEGYSPAYLKASGTADLVVSGSSGRTSRTVDIEADAGSALPLANERGSLFAGAVRGGGSLLSQLMTYQLTSLAQYRVLNGYGSAVYYGDAGTASIITDDDVLRSYESCRGALSSLYLSTPDGEWSGECDAASLFLSGDLVLDFNMIYAQALYGAVDDIAARWFEYFGGRELISLIDDVADTFADLWGKVTGFLTGKDTDSAEDYIEDVCGDVGYGVRKGESFTLVLDDETSYTVSFPEADVLDIDAVTSFYSDYRHATDGLMDWIVGIINSAVTSIAEDKDLGVLRFTVSKDEPFPDALCSRALAAARGSLESMEESLADAIDRGEFHDRLSAAVWHAVDDAKWDDLLYDMDAFASECRGIILDETAADIPVETLVSNPSFQEAHAAWRADVDRILSGMSPLLTVEAKNDGIIKQGCTYIVRGGLHLADMRLDLEPKMAEICTEFADGIRACGWSGTNEYPSAEGITLADGDMSQHIELECNVTSSPRIGITVDRDSCVHATGIGDSSVASFTTVWRIMLKDDLGLEITSSDAASSSSDNISARFSTSVPVDTVLTVSAVSGWALYGIEYEASNTLQGDVLGLIYDTFLGLIDPMLDLMKSLQEIMTLVGDAVSRLSALGQDAVGMMFEKLNIPLRIMNDSIVRELTDSGCRHIMEMLGEIERTYSITLSNQTVYLTYGGWELKLTFYLGTLQNYTKHLVKATLSGEVGGADFSSTLDVKVKGSDDYTPVVTGRFSVVADGWDVEGTVDPAMAAHNYMLEIGGNVRGTGFLIDLPVLEQFREVDLSLCDIPAVGLLLSDIPFLIPGTSVSLDAGLDVKYNAPITSGVIINEVEANPPGNDRDSEWAEILNLSSGTADLSGWSLTTSKFKSYTIPDGTELRIGERMVFVFPGMFLNNNSESLTLSDADGIPVSKVRLINDSADDARSCQRAMDGMTEWGLYESTCDAKNSGGLFGKDGSVTKACLDILKDAATEALGELGGEVTTEEGIAELIRLTLAKALDKGIDTLANMLTEASVYLKVEFSDITSTATLVGFRIHLTADSTLAGDVLRYLVGRVAEMVFNVEDPYGIDLGLSASDNVYLGVTVYTGMGMPSFLDPSGDNDVRLGADVSANISAIKHAMGMPCGTVIVRAGIAGFNAPSASLPPVVGADPKLSSDLWLFRIVLMPGAS